MLSSQKSATHRNVCFQVGTEGPRWKIGAFFEINRRLTFKTRQKKKTQRKISLKIWTRKLLSLKLVLSKESLQRRYMDFCMWSFESFETLSRHVCPLFYWQLCIMDIWFSQRNSPIMFWVTKGQLRQQMSKIVE